jgi:hypothetical protein
VSRQKQRRRKRDCTGPAVSGPFARAYWHLRRLARRRGLFVLFDGDPASPRLTFYDAVLGVVLVVFWPSTRRWAFADRPARGGTCQGHEDVLNVARRAAGAARAAACGRVSRPD